MELLYEIKNVLTTTTVSQISGLLSLEVVSNYCQNFLCGVRCEEDKFSDLSSQEKIELQNASYIHIKL